jgi:hypothetical protein
MRIFPLLLFFPGMRNVVMGDASLSCWWKAKRAEQEHLSSMATRNFGRKCTRNTTYGALSLGRKGCHVACRMAEEMRRICFKTLAAFGCRLSWDKNRLFSLRSDNEPSQFDTLEIAPDRLNLQLDLFSYRLHSNGQLRLWIYFLYASRGN